MKMSGNKGITLISLVVTIIVLLILAGISIMTLTGDNSILRQATNAKEKSDLAQAEERIKLAVNSAYMDENGKLNYEKLISSLENEFKNGNYEITPNNSNAESWTITVGKAEVQMKNENYVAPTAVYAYKATKNGNTDTLVLSSKGDLTSANGYSLDVYRNASNEPYDISEVEFTSYNMNPWCMLSDSYIKYVNIIDQIAPKYCAYWFCYCENLEQIYNISNLKTNNVTNMNLMFCSCKSLTNIDLTGFNTSNVTKMMSMFNSCDSLTNIDLSSLDTRNVTDMALMFAYSKLESIDLSSLDTSNVTSMFGMFQYSDKLTTVNFSGIDTGNVINMQQMFCGCSDLTTLDLSDLDTNNVTSMSAMFNDCSKLTNIDLSSFNTSKVTNMSYMFNDCSKLTNIDLSSFNTSKVTDMSYMFNSIKATNLDLSSFDTSKVTKMMRIFNGSSSLQTIYVSNKWTTANVTDESTYVFPSSCKLRNFSSSNLNYRDRTYAHSGEGGYLTLKTQ